MKFNLHKELLKITLEKRVLKFRVWNEATKTMDFVVNNINIKPDGDLSYPFYTTSGGLRYSQLMEYIGMQDDNGLDIYEGDIVHVKANFDSAKGVVCFYDSSFCFKIITNDPLECPYRKLDSGWLGVKIIGSVFTGVSNEI